MIHKAMKRLFILLMFVMMLSGADYYFNMYTNMTILASISKKLQMNDIYTKSNTMHGDINNSEETLFNSTWLDLKIQQTRIQIRNVPINLFEKNVAENKNNCVQLPTLNQIKFNNLYWQVFERFFIYSSYYDARPILKLKSFVRIIVMKSGKLSERKLYCQIWFDGGTLLSISEVSSVNKLRKQQVHSETTAYMLSCRISSNITGLIPNAVSLVKNPCDMATNLVRVVHNMPKGDKKDFAVCVKALDYPYYDKSKFLVEWIEILQIFGVDKIVLYEYDVHPNISKVLDYYQYLGIVEVIPLTLPGFQPNLFGLLQRYLSGNGGVKRETEQIPYNDCFYMNMNKYNYIAVLDTDEIIMPRKHKTWKDMIETIDSRHMHTNKANPTHYPFKGAVSLNSMRESHGWDPATPRHMYMLQNVYRSKIYYNTKSIVNTSSVIIVFNHYPTLCEGPCISSPTPLDIALYWHYRNSCKKDFLCKEQDVVKDTEIFRFKDEMTVKTSKVLRILNLL